MWLSGGEVQALNSILGELANEKVEEMPYTLICFRSLLRAFWVMSLINRNGFIPISRSGMETIPSQCVFIGWWTPSDAFFFLTKNSPHISTKILIRRKGENCQRGKWTSRPGFLHKFTIFHYFTMFRDPDTTQIFSETIRAFRSGKTQKLSWRRGGVIIQPHPSAVLPRHDGGERCTLGHWTFFQFGLSSRDSSQLVLTSKLVPSSHFDPLWANLQRYLASRWFTPKKKRRKTKTKKKRKKRKENIRNPMIC